MVSSFQLYFNYISFFCNFSSFFSSTHTQKQQHSPKAATCSAVSPHELLCLTLVHLFCNSLFATSKRPSAAAVMSGVRPLVETLPASEGLCERRSWTVARWPVRQAMCSAFHPMFICMLLCKKIDVINLFRTVPKQKQNALIKKNTIFVD